MTDRNILTKEQARPSDERNGCFLDKMWCCKVCDGEIPDGHTEDCDIWKLEKKHRDFLANEHNAVLIERDRLRGNLTLAEDGLASAMQENGQLKAYAQETALALHRQGAEIERLRDDIWHVVSCEDTYCTRCDAILSASGPTHEPPEQRFVEVKLCSTCTANLALAKLEASQIFESDDRPRASHQVCDRCRGSGRVPSPGGVEGEYCPCGRCGGSGHALKSTEQHISTTKKVNDE